MLDGLLGRGFAAKCKSLIKLTKSRIDVLRRKRNATIKFLKKDLAELLVNELDVNAHGRAGGLLDELRLLWNLDFVEKSCDIVLKHLSVMQKQRECPEECREAVSSLMFAAGGFSELLELRELRNIFHERYGDSLELFVNQEFVESLSSKPSSPEKKIKLMEDIALEFNIQWSSQDFEQRMARHNADVQDQRKNYGSSRSLSEKNISVTGSEISARGDGIRFTAKTKSYSDKPRHEIPSIERAKSADDGLRSHAKDGNESERGELSWSKQDPPSQINVKEQSKTYASPCIKLGRYGPINGNETAGRDNRNHSTSRGMLGTANHGSKSHGKEACERNKTPYDCEERNIPIYDSEDTFQRKINHETLFQGKQGNGKAYGEHISSKAVRSNNSWKGTDKFGAGSKLHDGREIRENAIPPRESPRNYFDRNANGDYWAPQLKAKTKDSFGRNRKDGAYGNDISASPFHEEDKHKPKYYNSALPPPPPYVKPNTKQNGAKKGSEYSHAGFNGNPVLDGSLSERAEVVSSHPDYERHEDNSNHHDDALAKRSSRRRHLKSSGHDDEDVRQEKRRTRSRRKESSRRGLQILLHDEHSQEDEEERIIDKLLMHYSRKPSSYEDMKIKSKSRSRRHSRNVDPDGDETHHRRSRNVPDSMVRMPSPPARSISLPTNEKAPSKVFSRAASFEPDRSTAARHVHPKLPDYDDLAARFAALKGR